MGRINESLLRWPSRLSHEVEAILNKIPNMIDCHVVGVNNRLLGTIGLVWIGKDVSKSDILKFARSNLLSISGLYSKDLMNFQS